MQKWKILCFIVFVYCPFAAANPLKTFASGGHVIGNGGGTAELEMTKFWSNLKEILTPCLYTEECGLDSGEKSFIGQTINDVQSCFFELEYKAVASDQTFTVGECGQPVIVNSKFLYLEEDMPKDRWEIYRVGVQLLFQLNKVKTSDFDEEQLTTRIIFGLKRMSNYVELSPRLSGHRFMVLFDEIRLTSNLIYYCGKKRLSTQHLFYRYFACDENHQPSLSLRDVYVWSFSGGRVTLKGNMSLECDGKVYDKSFHVSIDKSCNILPQILVY